MYITFKGSVMNEYRNVKDTIIKELVKDTGEAGLTLFLYYQSKEQTYKWRNEAVAEDLGWSLAKLNRIKKKLQMFGWIDYWRASGNTYYYIGKRQVFKSRRDRAEAEVAENPYFIANPEATYNDLKHGE